MIANEKLPPFKWAIVYYNRFLFLAGVIGLGAYFLVQWSNGGSAQQFLSYVLVTGLSFGLYEVLYQSRGTLFSMGHTRFYFLIILFYIPFLVNVLLVTDFTPISLSYNTITNNFENAVYYKLAIFSLSIAVFWFIFGVEFEKPSRKEMDIKALLVEDKKLHIWNEKLVLTANILSTITISIYSIPLGILVLIVLSMHTFIGKPVATYLALAVGVCCVLIGLTAQVSVLNLAHGWIQYWLHNGFWAMILRQFYSFGGVLNVGGSLIAAPLFLLSALAELRLTKADIRNIELYKKERQKANDTGGDFEIGINPITSKPVKLTDNELNSHALFLGTTGGGKTTAIMSVIEHCAIKGIPCIVMDGKGSPDLPEKIKYLAKQHGRIFKLFTIKPEILSPSLQENLAAYNPFSTGTHTEWKNRLMSLFAEADGRGQQHYVLREEDMLNLLVSIIKKSGAKVDLKMLLQYVKNIDVIKEMALMTQDNDLIIEVEKLDAKNLGDISIVLNLFVNSSFGYLFDTKSTQNVIELQKSIINNEIVLFLFDSSAFKEDTKKIAKMVINDINSAFSTIRERTGDIKKCYCIFDEFASYASSNLSDTLTLHRTNGVHAIIGTQSIKTVSLASSETARVAEELIGCCGTYLVLQLQHDEDIERVAKIFGTRKSFEVTRQIDVSEGGGATGMGSTKYIDEFIVHPQLIRELYGTEGAGYLYRKANAQKAFKIILRRVKTND